MLTQPNPEGTDQSPYYNRITNRQFPGNLWRGLHCTEAHYSRGRDIIGNELFKSSTFKSSTGNQLTPSNMSCTVQND